MLVIHLRKNCDQNLVKWKLREYDITSIAFPQIGCGLGGLDWVDVKPLIIEAFKDTDMRVVLVEPF